MSIAISDRQRDIWSKLKSREEFSVAQIAELGVSEDTARRYVRKWLSKRAIKIHRMERRTTFYAAVREPKLDGNGKPIIPTPEGNMWRTMRQLVQFSPTDIASHSSLGGIQVDEQVAQAYCRDLMDAGFVKCLKKARPGQHEAHYQLINNTGPEAPTVRRVKGVYDPNTETFEPNFKGGLPWERF